MTRMKCLAERKTQMNKSLTAMNVLWAATVTAKNALKLSNINSVKIVFKIASYQGIMTSGIFSAINN